jgi:type IV secretory pathway TraG/TraD family ATPase VirD4
LRDGHKHLQLLGETRNGKTVAATVLLAQCALLRETVIVLDPKADKNAPSVLKAAAERAGVPFVYIDLRPDQPPQFSPLSGASPSEVEELLISCFDLSAKGTDADVYRVEDRAAARKLAHSGATSFAEMVALSMNDKSITDARKFFEDLQELAAHPVIQTSRGWRLDEWIGRPAVIYISGSARHDNTVRLQKLVLLRLLQLIDRYGAADDANWSALFIDEFKYLLSPGALRALGTIGDRNCHLMVAHQSLGDLRDVAGLDPGAVNGAVVVNTGLKLFYKTNDPETALWVARLSGQIPSFAESISKGQTTGATGAYQERTRPLIDENMLLAMPPLTGMLYGSGIAKLLAVSYLPKASEPPAVTPAPEDESRPPMDGPI